MTYTQRLANLEDAKAIAPLMAAFAQERESADPSMLIKPNFDFEKYVAHLLDKPLSLCYVLESSPQTDKKTIIGCLFIYFYNEAPPPNLPENLTQQHELENPFQPRRVGSVLGLYVKPEHRHPEAIKLLADAGIQHAEKMKVTDIDLLIAADQTGIQALLQRAGFTKAAVQYTRHYDIPTSAQLPSLHPPHPELGEITPPAPSAIPLRQPDSNSLVRNPHGEPVFLAPIANVAGDILKTSTGLPVYPTPVRDPQTNDWVFDSTGNLVACPPLRDEHNQIVEHQSIPQFHPPAYEIVSGKIHLKRDADGKCVFCDVERDSGGKMVKTPDGMPVFKMPVLG